MSTAHTDDMLELAALYALDAVDASECGAVRDHILGCELCRAEYGAARAAASGFAASVAQTPPPALRSRIMDVAAARPRAQKIVPLLRRKRFYVALVAAAAAIAAVLMFRSPGGIEHRSWSVACLPASAACGVSGHVIEAAGVLRLEASGLAALPSGKVYQAWLIQPGGKPIPEPTFTADAGGRVSVDVPARQPKGTLIAVTVEPAGGSQAPTTTPFAAATLN